jgi:hypothetical protein
MLIVACAGVALDLALILTTKSVYVEGIAEKVTDAAAEAKVCELIKNLLDAISSP